MLEFTAIGGLGIFILLVVLIGWAAFRVFPRKPKYKPEDVKRYCVFLMDTEDDGGYEFKEDFDTLEEALTAWTKYQTEGLIPIILDADQSSWVVKSDEVK